MKNYRTIAKSILATSAFVLVCSAFTLVKAPANFSGEWKLNESKSDLGQFANFAAKKMKVEATETSATVERTRTGRDGQEQTSKETLSYDGKETESTVFGNSKKKSTVKWSDDGQAMTVNAVTLIDRNGQTMEIKTQETWKLSDEGKTLTIDSKSSSSFGEMATKMVYDKSK